MAGRIRSIKPEILEDEKTASLTHLEWRVFVSLWLVADDYGNLRGEPDYVRGQVLWASAESRETVAKALETLARVSLLTPYRVRGQSYLHITGWSKHQKVDKPGKPRMPGPSESDDESSREVTPNSRESRESPAKARESLETDLRPTTYDHDRDREEEASRDSLEPDAVTALAKQTWKRVSDARLAIAAKHGQTGVLPLRVTPSSGNAAYANLKARIREEGADAARACDHVVAGLVEQAEIDGDVEWLSEKAFTPGGWQTARSAVLGKPKRAGPKGSAARAPERNPVLQNLLNDIADHEAREKANGS